MRLHAFRGSKDWGREYGCGVLLIDLVEEELDATASCMYDVVTLTRR